MPQGVHRLSDSAVTWRHLSGLIKDQVPVSLQVLGKVSQGGIMLELEKETKGPNNGRVGICRRKCQDVPRYWGTE